jgi:hypothetical protein
MTVPIEAAYLAAQTAIAEALVAASFLSDAAQLEVDPTAPFEPDDESDDLNPAEFRTAAALLQLDTKPVRTLMGGPVPRYVVERQVRLELASYGGDKDVWGAALLAAETAVAGLPGSNPTLGGSSERFMFVEAVAEPLEPNGDQRFITFAIRVRSSDPLGKTAA